MQNRPTLTSINTQENLLKKTERIHTELLTGKVKEVDIPTKILELNSYYLKTYDMQANNEACNKLKEEMEAYAEFAADFLRKIQTEVTQPGFLMRNSQKSFSNPDSAKTIRDTLKGFDLDTSGVVAIIEKQKAVVHALQQGTAYNPASKFFRSYLNEAEKIPYPVEEITYSLDW